MELLSPLPRGTGPLGLYEEPAQHVPLVAVRFATDVPAEVRTELELLRTDTERWPAYVEARRWRHERAGEESPRHS